MSHIKHQGELLRQIADGLRRIVLTRPQTPLGSLEVVFAAGEHSYEFGLVEALDALGADTYWDERGNWSEATAAAVRVL